uniref:Uncharacterized protein n=1 Tax=Tanacetum cinerariifolium TaxID=118510 RepID=A0A699T941_TANCI|nr:hypothetical protein [Tanacetum cinerariifolium]
MSYEPKSIQKAIEFANDQMDQKLLGIADRQADNKRKGRSANTNNNNNNNNYNNWRATAAYQGVPTCFSVELKVISRIIARSWETEIRGIKIRLGMEMMWQEHMDWVLQEETQTPMS